MGGYIIITKTSQPAGQPIVGPSQIWNLSLCDYTRLYKYLIWRRPPIEDYLKIFKVKYLRNQGLDLTQIWDLPLGYQTKLYKCFKLRQPQTKEDLKILNWIFLKLET